MVENEREPETGICTDAADWPDGDTKLQLIIHITAAEQPDDDQLCGDIKFQLISRAIFDGQPFDNHSYDRAIRILSRGKALGIDQL